MDLDTRHQLQRTGNKNAAKRVDAREKGNDFEFRMNYYYEIVDSTQNEISSNKLCIFDVRISIARIRLVNSK